MSFAESHRYDAMGLADLISRGEVRPSEVVGEAIDTIERHNPTFNAVIYKMYDRAQARASRIPASVNGLFGLKPTRARTPCGPVFGESWFG